MSQVRRSLLASFTEKYSTLLINVASTAILARLLTPKETGLYSVVWGLVDIAHALREFGVGNYILQHGDLTRKRLSGIIGVSITLGGLLAACFAIAAPFLADFFDEPRVRDVTLVMCLNFLFVSYANIGLARLQREMNFKAMMWISIAATFAHATVSITLASQGFGAIGMAWASVTGVLVSLMGGWLYHRGDFFIPPSFAEGRHLFAFGLFASGGSLLQAVGARVPDIVIGRLLGLAPVGLYSRGNSLITLFEQTLMGVVNPVALSALAICHRKNEELAAPYLRYLSYATVVAWPCLGLMGLLALPIIDLAFGEQWLASVPVARILCLAAALTVLGVTSITLLNAIGAVRRLLWVQAIAVPLQVTATIVGCHGGIEGVAWGFTASALLLAVLLLREVRRITLKGWRPILSVLSSSGLVTLGTLVIPGSIVLWQGLSAERFVVTALAAALAGGAGWLAVIFAARHPLHAEILAILKFSRP